MCATRLRYAPNIFSDFPATIHRGGCAAKSAVADYVPKKFSENSYLEIHRGEN